MDVGISHRFWIRIPIAPVLGFLAFTVGRAAHHVVQSGLFFFSIGEFDIVSGLVYGSLPVLMLTLAADLYLRIRMTRPRSVRALGLFALLGALSGCLLQYELVPPAGLDYLGTGVEFSLYGLVEGVAFGLALWVGMLGAVAVDRRMRRGAESIGGQAQV